MTHIDLTIIRAGEIQDFNGHRWAMSSVTDDEGNIAALHLQSNLAEMLHSQGWIKIQAQDYLIKPLDSGDIVYYVSKLAILEASV